MAKRTRKIQLIEYTTSDATLRVDRDAGVIHGVKVLGCESKNNRRYTDAAISGARSLYEGVGVNVDHPDLSSPDVSRPLAARFGQLTGVVHGQDGLRADLHYLKAHPLAEMIAEAAERMPTAFGLSHNADGNVTQSNGDTIVEEITRVRSVDLVTDPATTRSLFESEQTRGGTVKTTIAEVLKENQKSTLMEAQMLREIVDGEMAPAETPVEAPAGPSGDESIKAAFRAAVVAAFDDESLDLKATLKRMKEVLSAHEKLMAKAEPSDVPAVTDEVAEVVPESKQAKQTPGEAKLLEKVQQLEAKDNARELLEAAGVQASPVKLTSLIALGTVAERQALIETWEPDTGISQQPQSGSPLFEQKQNGDFQAPKDQAEFLAGIRG